MFSTGLVITVDIKPDGAIKINNRPLKIFDYTSSMKAPIVKCNNQDLSVYMISLLRSGGKAFTFLLIEVQRVNSEQ